MHGDWRRESVTIEAQRDANGDAAHLANDDSAMTVKPSDCTSHSTHTGAVPCRMPHYAVSHAPNPLVRLGSELKIPVQQHHLRYKLCREVAEVVLY